MSNEQPSSAAGGLELLRHCPRIVLVLAAAVTLLLFEGIVLLTAVGRSQSPDPEPAVASRAAPARTTLAALRRRQPVLPPLAAEAATDPGHGPLFTPDLAQVAAPAAPVPVLPPPPPPPVVPAPPAPPAETPVTAEPPPAVPEDDGLDLPGPLTVYLDLLCPGISVGPLDLRLPCHE